MLDKKGTNIYSLEGKDIYNNILKINKNKKFKAVFDYSLEAIQIEKIAQSVYKTKRDRNNIFYQINNKQYTNKIINVTFKYNLKEYNPIVIKNKKYFVHYESKDIDYSNVENLEFKNGIYIENNKIQVIKLGEKTNIQSIDLPKGFCIKDNEIQLTSSGMTTIANTDKIRKDLYNNGFKIEYENELIEYVRFKRSSGSSRVGKCLFIDKRLYKEILKWSMMEISFRKNQKTDLAALEAYIALTTSSIVDTIQIKPENILLIDDYYSEFENEVMTTHIVKEKYINDEGNEIERDRLKTEPMNIKITNNIWDGQSLLDSSIFNGENVNNEMHWVKDNKYANKGMLLLRNRFFKSCCFNTNIQKFFNDNNITSINQLNGFTMANDVKDIKLITTPSSIKYLKFGTKEDYFNNLDSTFGIVKYDKPTHYFNGNMVQTHYQLINTLQFTKEDMKEFLKDSLDYVKMLKTDIRVFRNHLHIKPNESIENEDIDSTNKFMMTMLKLNDKFENTNVFNSFRQEVIKSYINNMKKAHILVHGNYSVLCGNGLEMLKYSCVNKENKPLFNGDSLLNVDEVYCRNFKYNKKLLGSRSPHVTISNIWILNNCNKVKANEIKKYFNASNQIVYVNSINNNILERLSSADFDSDSLLLTDNDILISKAEKNYNNFLVPTNQVEATKVQRLNTLNEKSDLDIKTSKNLIGDIINCSQILNSMLWDMMYKGAKCDDENIQSIFSIISQLDVMSCIEIDSAKKEFTIDNKLELDDIKNTFIKGKKKPMFFKFLSKEKGIKVNPKKYKKYNTSMDYLIEIIDEETKKIRQKRRDGENAIVKLSELIDENNNIPLANVKNTKLNKIIEYTNKYKSKIINIWNSDSYSQGDKYYKSKDERDLYINEIKNINLEVKDIKKVICSLSKDIKDNNSKIILRNSRSILTTLYEVYPKEFISIFKSTKENILVLKPTNDIIDKNNEKIVKIYNMSFKEVLENQRK